ncbi:MAG: MarR family transcriptional regulator [Mycobacterium sp.]|uniref:MarR family transcriptional regulator n=1 Tax=Mycobacterium sp. TaxID=1785 RepID=UPI003CC63B81
MTSRAGTAELAGLQAVRLKGRVSLAALTDTLDEDPAAVNHTVERLTGAGLLVHDKTLRLSGEGRARLAELLAAERRHVDRAALINAYNEFRAVNAEFKAAVTDWQLKAGEPNSHDDANYDAAIVARIDSVHRRVLPTLAAVAAQLPRLSSYSVKLQQALDKVKAGDTTWLTRPIVDSYHTVWFELHEELIAAAGLTREAEARRGHAQ